MEINGLGKIRITLKTKIILLAAGFFLFLAMLEIGLRFGGFVLSSVQEYRNRQAIKQKGAYRILCLGESTTEGQYPKLLEEILNRRNIGVRFSVIDKGKSGTITTAIVSHLESYLDEYHPDAVVAMMGINDSGEHIPYEEATTSKGKLLLRSMRTYKLARLLWLHIVAKAKETGLYKPGRNWLSEGVVRPVFSRKQTKEPSNGDYQGYIRMGILYKDQGKYAEAEDALKKALAIDPENDQAYVEFGWLYNEQGRSKFREAEEAFKKAKDLNPENERAYTQLGWVYRNQDKFAEAEEVFKKAKDLNPKNDEPYAGLGWTYRDQGKLPEAEESFRKAIEFNPRNDQVFVGLGWIYYSQVKFTEAEESFKKAIELNSNNDQVYVGLGWLYQNQDKFPSAEDFFNRALVVNPKNHEAYIGLGSIYRAELKFPEAEESFKKAIQLNAANDRAYIGLGLVYRDELKLLESEQAFKEALNANPENDEAYFMLGWMYRIQGKLALANELFGKSLEVNPKNDKAQGAILSLYEEMEKPELARKYAEKVNRFRVEYCSLITVKRYRELKAILDKRGVQLVCVQYPMRNIEPLRKIFLGSEQGIVFVSNEDAFKKAVIAEGYSEYFRDMFGGDFGHCTVKGNVLLAENICNVIVKEIFGR